VARVDRRAAVLSGRYRGLAARRCRPLRPAAGTGRVNVVHVPLGPLAESFERTEQRPTERGEGVFRMGWYDGVHGPGDETVVLQAPKRLSQHLLGNAANLARQIAVALRLSSQPMHDEDRPFVRDEIEHLLRGTAVIEDVWLMDSTHHEVGIAQGGAYFPRRRRWRRGLGCNSRRRPS
jgi:hypothetical protein